MKFCMKKPLVSLSQPTLKRAGSVDDAISLNWAVIRRGIIRGPCVKTPIYLHSSQTYYFTVDHLSLFFVSFFV